MLRFGGRRRKSRHLLFRALFGPLASCGVAAELRGLAFDIAHHLSCLRVKYNLISPALRTVLCPLHESFATLNFDRGLIWLQSFLCKDKTGPMRLALHILASTS